MTNTYGYAATILRVDLSTGKLTHLPTMEYADRFIGGMGVAARIYWDEVAPEVRAFDPENRLLFMNGPTAAFPGVSGSRWVVCGKCPTTRPEQFATSNFGGRWGAYLKLSGYDGVIVQGKSERPVYLLIDEDGAELREASHLWGRGALETRDILKRELGDKVAVAACGQAGENKVVFASIIADNDAAGGNGLGAVMGSKNLKAVAVARGSRRVVAANPARLKELNLYIARLRQGFVPPAVHPPAAGLDSNKKDPCFACQGQCNRVLGRTVDGRTHKALCVPSIQYHATALSYYGEKFKETPDADVPMRAIIMTDDYGLDMFSLVAYLRWLAAGREGGLFTDENTGLPMAKFGSWEFLNALLKKVTFREGFGDILAQGIWKAGELLGGRAQELLATGQDPVEQDGRLCPSCPRAFPAHALLVATQPTMHRQQQHEMTWVHYRWLHTIDESYEGDRGPAGKDHSYFVNGQVFRNIAKTFWGSESAADFSTYEGKALAAKMILDRSYVKESMVLCDFHWPIVMVASSDDHVGDPSIESKVLSAVTGREIDEEALSMIGERIANVRRAITVRERGGRESDTLSEYMFTRPLPSASNDPECRVPGHNGEIMSLAGAVVDRTKFEQMKDEFYQLRGWDVATGLQTKEKLEQLGLADLLKDLAHRSLAL